jgi:hypothetical protein
MAKELRHAKPNLQKTSMGGAKTPAKNQDAFGAGTQRSAVRQCD